jgi:hypothetical protein
VLHLFSEYWERHRQFFNHVLAGAGIFLVLAFVTMSFGSEGDRDRKRRRSLLDQVRTLQARVGGRGGLPAGSLEEVEEALRDRAREVGIEVPQDLAKERSLPTRFLAEKDAACAELSRRAAGAGVDIKVNLTAVDFHQRDTDDAVQYAEHWGTLACFKRILEAAIGAGFPEILAVACESPARAPVPGEARWALARYGVRVDLVGTFEDFVRLYAAVNGPGKFVHLELESLRRRGVDGEGLLQGQITAWAVRLVEETERAEGPDAGAGLRRFKR